MIRMVLALIALVLIAMPAPAMAQQSQTNAPPGNSAIDEYLETVPGATGNRSPRPPAGGASSALTPGQRARLEQLGSDGKQLADVVDATSPAGAASRAHSATPPAAEGRSPLTGVLDAATGRDGGGMGALLPTILVGTLLGAIALLVLRRRSAS